MYKTKFNELFNKIITEMQDISNFQRQYDNRMPNEYWSDEEMRDLSNFEECEYFVLTKPIKFNDKNYMVVFKGEAVQEIDSDYNAQICNVTPDLTDIKVYDVQTLTEVNLSKEELNHVITIIKKTCKDLFDSPVQDTDPNYYMYPVPDNSVDSVKEVKNILDKIESDQLNRETALNNEVKEIKEKFAIENHIPINDVDKVITDIFDNAQKNGTLIFLKDGGYLRFSDKTFVYHVTNKGIRLSSGYTIPLTPYNFKYLFETTGGIDLKKTLENHKTL